MLLRSLRSRLTVGVVSVLAVVLTGAGLYVAGDADRSERRAVDDRLRRTAELSDTTALAAVEQELPQADERLDQVLRATGSSLRVSIGRTTLLRAGIPISAGRAPLGFSTRTVDGRELRVFTKTLRDDSLGGLARLEASTSLAPVEAHQARLRRRLLLIGLAMLVLTAIGTSLAAELVLRPLRRLRGTAGSIEDDGDLRRRVPVGGPTEIRALAGSFNAMLERLGRSADERHRALEATRRFAADVGHELRTPLTSVQAALSTIARHPDVDPETRALVVDDALAEQRRLVALLDGLQALARGDATPAEHATVDLAATVADSVQAAVLRHPDVDVSSRLPSGPVPVRGWEPGLRMLVDNLVENGARHGRPDGRVRVTVDALPDGVRLEVEDDGPGIAVADRERLFEPFVRAAGTDRPGSGLGLALVAQQARHHGAVVAIDVAELGGARVSVRFPPPAPDPAA